MTSENYYSSAAGKRRKALISPSSPVSKLGDNEDLIVEILIRLPGHRSAFRCKSVCKSWNSLISTPYFIRRFVSHHHTLPAAADAELNLPIMTFTQIRQSILTFLPFPHETQFKFSVLDYTNDLLLLGFRGPEIEPELRRTHLVCNPFTKQWLALPLAPKMSTKNDRWIVKLVCDDNQLNNNNPLQELPCRFRVLRMYVPSRPATSRVDVYTFCSSSGRWKKFVLTLDRNLKCTLSYRVVSKKGKLYWMNYSTGVVKWDLFSIEQGAVPTLMEDSKLRGSSASSCYLYGPWVSEGGLHVIWDEWHSKCWSVWRLEEEEEGGGRGSWKKQYTVDWSLNEVPNPRFHRSPNASAAGLHRDNSEVMFLLTFNVYSQPSAIFSWNSKEKELKYLVYQDQNVKLPVSQEKEVYQLRVGLWPNLVTEYENLRNAYNGSYSCWRSSITSVNLSRSTSSL